MFSNKIIKKITVLFFGLCISAVSMAQGLVTQPTSIAELARALHYDPNLIYEYVHNNVEFEPLWGLRKGGLGALLTSNGSSLDQADLMVKLINTNTQGNPSAVYELGSVTLTAADLKDWLGIPTNNVCLVTNVFREGGIPVWKSTPSATSCPQITGADLTPFNSTPITSITIAQVYVKAYIGGAPYYFDPSFKRHSSKTALNLSTITGYTAATHMSHATTGSTTTANGIQNINRTNIRADLTTYANNLASYLRSNLPAAAVSDVVGGRGEIIPVSGGSYQLTTMPPNYTSGAATALPSGGATGGYPADWSSWTPTSPVPGNDEYQTTPPLCFNAVLAVQYKDNNNNNLFTTSQGFYSSDIYGRRITLTFNASGQPVLMNNGTVVATGTTGQTTGTIGTIQTVALLPTPLSPLYSGGTSQAFTNAVNVGGTYLISNSWGASGRALVKYYQQQAATLKAAGNAATSEPVLGSMLASLSAAWITQSNLDGDLLARIAKSSIVYNAQIGVSGYYLNNPYVDLPGNNLSFQPFDGSIASWNVLGQVWAEHMSIFESTAVQQITGTSAVSTIKLIDLAALNGYTIYDAKTSNFSQISPSLVNCSSSLAQINTALAAGNRLVLPSHCDLSEGPVTAGIWRGVGFESISPANAAGLLTSISMPISGGYNGGYSDSPVSEDAFYNNGGQALNSSVLNNYNPLNSSSNTIFGDPVDITKGAFLYTSDDLPTGVGSFPQGLLFQKLYSSAAKANSGTMGLGWSNNFNINAAVGSDGFLAIGENSAIDAVGSIVQNMVATDLMASDSTQPLAKIVTALIGSRWFGDQMINNTVTITRGLSGETFMKLPDGTFHAPPGSTAHLIQNADTSYTYDTLHHKKFNFTAAGQVTNYTEPNGMQVNFTFDVTKHLTNVQNSLGRSLTFTYDANNRVQTVTDGTRTVSYGYDTSGNLISSTDANNKVSTFTYASPGLISQVFPAASPTVALLSNTYDSLGRVSAQTNANSGISNYYFAGTRSEEVSPTVATKVSYLDFQGHVLSASNPLGKVTINTFDGLGRLVKTIKPEGNNTVNVYDDVTCASTERRCTNNVLTVTQNQKPGSALLPIVTSSTYESLFNNIATVTDARAKVTSYTYTAQGLLLAVTSPTDASGNNPVTTNGYTAFSASGFPNFFLQTTKQVKLTPTITTTSTMAYNTANHFVPSSTIVDSGTGALNLTTNYTYDGVGNLTQTQGPRTDVSQIVAYAYDAMRNKTSMTNALNQTSYNIYDADNNVIQSQALLSAGLWMVSCKTYSTSDKVLAAWGPAQVSGALGSVACPAQSAPVSLTNYLYDSQDRLSQVTENLTAAQGGNRVTKTNYNLDDTVQSLVRAFGTGLQQNYQTYTYTNNGLAATVADANNNLTTYTYDGFDRKAQIAYPSKATAGLSSTTDLEKYTYDANNNVTSMVRRNGQTVTQAFDNLNRVSTRAGSDNFTYTYDLAGRRLTATSSNGTFNIVNTYDNAGRLTNTAQGSLALAYQYDSAGNRTKTTWPGAFFVSRTYDALNRLSTLSENGTQLLATYNYDPLSRRASITRPNGTSTTYAYDTQSALSGLTNDMAGTNADVTYAYTRNQVGDITNQSWSNSLFQWTGAQSGAVAYTSNGLNQYASVGSATISHDTNGNMNSDGVWNYTYNNDNQLTAASSASTTANLTYDADGRLRQTAYVAGTTTNLLYDGDALVGEYDTSGTTQRRYVHGSNPNEPLVWYEGAGTNSKYWLYSDHLGSVIATADSTGSASTAFTYGPYGEPGNLAGIRFRYNGKQLLSLGTQGIYYSKARMYSPAQGRFMQTDPTGYQDNMHLYAYVGNNPINRIDPNGTNEEQANSLRLSDLVAEDEEVFYRGMSNENYNILTTTGNLPPTSETFVSPSLDYALGYGDKVVQFNLNPGTTAMLADIGLRNDGLDVSAAYPNMPNISGMSGWGSSNAYFKQEGDNTNIGLGTGAALDLFNQNICSYCLVSP